MIIEKKYYFYAAHRNKSAGEKCGRIHGHTYDVICHFKFNDMKDGITMLFSDIDKVTEPIINKVVKPLKESISLLFPKDQLVSVGQIQDSVAFHKENPFIWFTKVFDIFFPGFFYFLFIFKRHLLSILRLFTFSSNGIILITHLDFLP
jgi:hypothetical protein